MNFIKSNLIAMVAVVIAIVGFVAHNNALFGAATPTGPVHYQGELFAAGLQIGQSGTFTQAAYWGTCNLTTSVTSFTATSTAQFLCSVPNVKAGDLVMVDLPPGAGANSGGAGSNYGGFSVVSAYATTTGIIGVTLANFTGTATTSYTQATTSVEYRVLH